MLAGTSYEVLRDSPFAHPTYAESLNSLFSAWASPAGGTVIRQPRAKTFHFVDEEADGMKHPANVGSA
jgi:hypothetical protein